MPHFTGTALYPGQGRVTAGEGSGLNLDGDGFTIDDDGTIAEKPFGISRTAGFYKPNKLLRQHVMAHTGSSPEKAMRYGAQKTVLTDQERA